MQTVKAEDLNPTRPSLLERVKNWDDSESWQVFYDTYARLIYSVAFQAGLRHAEAEDATEETLISITQNIRDFNYDPAIGKFRSWLIRNTLWRVGDQFKKRKKAEAASVHPDVDPEDLSAVVEEVADPSESEITRMCEVEWAKHVVQLALAQVKKRVNPRDYNIYEMLVLHEVPSARVAELFELTPANIHVIKSRVGDVMREELERLQNNEI